MEFARFWLPPAVLGLVVSILGVGVAEVSGLTPDPQEPAMRAAPPVQPDPSPAQIEVAEDADVESPPPAPVVTRTQEPEEDPESEPTTASTVAPTPSPSPSQTRKPKPSAAPKPRHPRPKPSPEIRRKPPRPAPRPAPTLAGQLIDLTNWKLTLPTGSAGSPTEIRQPQLAHFAAPGMFGIDGRRRGVVFRASAGGVTTEHSSYPRAELREMTGSGATEAGWSNTSGTHVMSIAQAITAVPPAKPHVVAGQIHDAEDDVIMIRLEGTRLFVESDGNEVGLLDPAYRLGTRFDISLIAAEGHLHVHYNGSPKVLIRRSIDGAYFKAGCYTQSNPSKGDSPSAYGEVVIYALTVRHS